MTTADKSYHLVEVDGNVVDKLTLEKSKEVALGVSRKGEKLIGGNVMTSSDVAVNWETARVSKDRKRSLQKGIQLYRLWFNFLKLALELETKNVSLVRRYQSPVKDALNNPYVPQSVLNQGRKERMEVEGYKVKQSVGTKKGSGVKYISDNPVAIWKTKLIQKVKVKTSAYKGWDLDEVLERPFDGWWKTHHHLFEGYYPTLLKKKDEWIDKSNFLYVRLDKNTKWLDVQKYMNEEVRKEFKSDRTPQYTISGIPRVLVCQNNFNALVLRIKGWKSEDIINHKNIYLRNTDESMTASRIKGNRLTVSKDKKGKLLYSKVVSKQTLQGVHHLFEVCEGSFGKTLPTK